MQSWKLWSNSPLQRLLRCLLWEMADKYRCHNCESQLVSHGGNIVSMQKLTGEHKHTTESSTLQVLKESSTQVHQAFQMVKDIRDGWPEALRGIKTSQLARERLNDQVNFLSQLEERGLVQQLFIACRVHGVFWALAHKFGIVFEITMLCDIKTAFLGICSSCWVIKSWKSWSMQKGYSPNHGHKGMSVINHLIEDSRVNKAMSVSKLEARPFFMSLATQSSIHNKALVRGLESKLSSMRCTWRETYQIYNYTIISFSSPTLKASQGPTLLIKFLASLIKDNLLQGSWAKQRQSNCLTWCIITWETCYSQPHTFILPVQEPFSAVMMHSST